MRRRALPLHLLIVSASAASAAGADEPRPPWTNQERVRSIAASVMADAETRSSLSPGAGLGHDGRFFIGSEDGAFRLSPGGVVQSRYHYYRSRDREDDFGFSTPRMRLIFAGRMGRDLSFLIRMGITKDPDGASGFDERSSGGIFALERSWIRHRINDHWAVRGGTQVFQLSRETEHSPEKQLGVDTSPTESVFDLGSYDGVEAVAEYEHVRAWFTFSDGADSALTGVEDAATADGALSFKGDWKLAGEWDRFDNFTSFPGDEFAAMLGAGVHWENGAMPEPEGGPLTLWQLIGELSLEGDGWNMYGAVHYRHIHLGSSGPYDDLGFIVQGGFFVADRVEPYARLDAVFPDPDRDADSEEFKTATVGFNVYPLVASVDCKLSVDLIYFFDDVEGSLVGPSRDVGVLAGGESGDFGVRAQFTLRF